MKKLTALFALLVLALSTASAAPDAARGVFEKTYDYKDFTALSISNAFHVELTFADGWNIEVQTPDFLEPYLRVECSDNKLQIDLEKIPTELQRKLSDRSDQLQARITMPTLHRLHLSGSSTLVTVGKLDVDDQNLRIQLSGASELNCSGIRGRDKLTVELSGAAKADIDMAFPTVDFDISGAARLRFYGNAKEMSVECSGASSAQIDGSYEELEATVSGSSKMNIGKNVGKLSLIQSGASKVDIAGTTGEGNVELAGVSRCSLSVKEKLRYDIAGVSTLIVKDLGASIKGSADRGSKIQISR